MLVAPRKDMQKPETSETRTCAVLVSLLLPVCIQRLFLDTALSEFTEWYILILKAAFHPYTDIQDSLKKGCDFSHVTAS